MNAGVGGVLIIDFGAQYCQLIARRIREMGVFSRITVPGRALFAFDSMQPGAVVLSGGPRSVYEDDAPKLPVEILELGVPVLGICYGLQWLTQADRVGVEIFIEKEIADNGNPPRRKLVDQLR